MTDYKSSSDIRCPYCFERQDEIYESIDYHEVSKNIIECENCNKKFSVFLTYNYEVTKLE